MYSNNNTQKVMNFLIYLTVGLVPLIFIPINGILNTSMSKLAGLTIISIFFLYAVLNDRNNVTFMENTLENKILIGYIIITTLSVVFSINWQVSLFGSVYRYDGLVAFYLYVFALSAGLCRVANQRE